MFRCYYNLLESPLQITWIQNKSHIDVCKIYSVAQKESNNFDC